MRNAIEVEYIPANDQAEFDQMAVVFEEIENEFLTLKILVDEPEKLEYGDEIRITFWKSDAF